jgi:hypothetical protein
VRLGVDRRLFRDWIVCAALTVAVLLVVSLL